MSAVWKSVLHYRAPLAAGLCVGGMWLAGNWDLLRLRWRFNKAVEYRKVAVTVDGIPRHPRLKWADRLPHGYKFGLALPPGLAPADLESHLPAIAQALEGTVTLTRQGRWDVIIVSRLPEVLPYEPARSARVRRGG